MTFDNYHYTFMGLCSYIAARAVDGKWSISVENIACGTNGVTCAKSVTVVYGNTIVDLVRGADVRVSSFITHTDGSVQDRSNVSNSIAIASASNGVTAVLQ